MREPDVSRRESHRSNARRRCPAGCSSHPSVRRAAAAALILLPGLLLSAAPPARATTLTGPFVGCQQATQPVVTNGTVFSLPNGNQHPVPGELQPTSAFTFLLVPDTGILVSQRAGGTGCVSSSPGGEPGHVLFFHQIPPTSGALLQALRTDVCIPERVAQAGHCIYDRRAPFSPQRIAAVRERTAPTAVDQRTLWIDLTTTGPDGWSSQTSPLQLTSYSPSGDAAVIQHDLDDPIGDPDWAVIDLCPGSVGSLLANVADLSGTVTVETVLNAGGEFVVRLTHASGAVDVLLPDCLGPPPPPPPTHARLTVTAVGPGDGEVREPPAIACATNGNPNLCQADYALGTMVTLFAVPRNQGAIFQGWSGDCTGTSTITDVTMAADRACSASFDEVRAELAVSLSPVPEPVPAGGPLTITATVANSGPDPALATTLTFTPPAGATVDLAQLPAGCGLQPSGDVRCNLGTLAPGGSATPAIVLDVDPFIRGTLSAAAAVATTTWESNLADNSTAAVSTVTVITDLALVKTAAPEPVSPGGLLVYRLEVTNIGPSASFGATLTDTLPPFVTLRSNPGTTMPSFAMGPLAPGRTAVGTVLVDVDPATPIGQALTNVADVAGVDPDPSAANNVASVVSNVAGPLAGSGPLGPFVLVADTSTPAPHGGSFSHFGFLPALDGDTVAFVGNVDGAVVDTVYRRVGGRIIEVAGGETTTPDGRAAFIGFDEFELSAWGDDVAFVGVRPQAGGPGIDTGFYRTGECFLEPLADRSSPTPLPFVFGGRMRGDEAVLLASGGHTPFHGIVRTDGQDLTVLYERTILPNGSAEQLGVPAWDGTTAAFWRAIPAGGILEESILSWRDGDVSTVVDMNTPVPGGPGTFIRFERRVSVDGDLIAFMARDGDGDLGIYVADLGTGVVDVVADVRTPIPGTTTNFGSFHVQSSPSVSAGRVAFAGSSAAPAIEGGIFLWQDGDLELVIANDHPLPPAGVAFPLMGRYGLSGDRLAFGNGLGVWVADLGGGPGVIFGDGFETGDTTAWSSTAP